MTNHLSLTDSELIYNAITQQFNTPDDDVLFLWEDVVRACAHYTKLRAEWTVTDLETKGHIGQSRTNAHNVVINSFVAFHRLVQSHDATISWGQTLGLSQPDTNRKRIGDFANYLTYMTALKGR